MTTITIQRPFSFGLYDVSGFDRILSTFNWGLSDHVVEIDLDHCDSANYQSLALLVPYIWKLKAQGKSIRIQSYYKINTAGFMWRLMGAKGWSQVLYNKNQNFNGDQFKPLIAIRNEQDFMFALSKVGDYTRSFNIGYEKTLRYVVSELLYNTMEHGIANFKSKKDYNRSQRFPSIIQFTWYRERNEFSLLVADLGIGIKKHLEQAYPAFETDADAIVYALKPKVSGTFRGQKIYQARNNAGIGLYVSSNIIRKLHADMYIVSGNGLVHISPTDVTQRTLNSRWPGTFVLVNVRLNEIQSSLNLQKVMGEFLESALDEIASVASSDEEITLTVSIENFFGRYAEDKQAAINFRTNRLLPAISEGKRIFIFNFANVESSPHSFLSALLAVPIQQLGLKAYKQIKIRNATTDIKETIDFILDENTGTVL